MFSTALSAVVVLLLFGSPQASPQAAADELFEAARAGDAARVRAILDKGVDVNAKARYGMTALSFAADRGVEAVVTLLLERGADVNVQDTFYKMRPLDLALSNGHVAVAKLLLDRGSRGAVNALMQGIRRGNAEIVTLALRSSELTALQLEAAAALAKQENKPDLLALITARAAAAARDTAIVAVERNVLQSYVGTYRSSNQTIVIALKDDQLTSTIPGQPAQSMVPTSTTNFRLAGIEGVTLGFAGRGGMIELLIVTQGSTTTQFERVSAEAAAAAATPAPAPAAKPDPAPPIPTAKRTAARPWPAFRGSNASGNGDGQGAVFVWDVTTGRNIRWKTPIPGIANSSPIVWGDRVFVTTAVSSAGDKTFRTGLYGDVAPVNDLSPHTWKIYCLDRASGKILWDAVAFTGVPKVKRHTKASQANSTPVTDGNTVVAAFGSIGLLAAWDVAGKPLWTKDIGVIDSGWFLDPEYQWGHSSSPVIHRNAVIVQADRQKDSFIAAYDLSSGKQLWRTDRDEISTWGTPTILSANGRDELVTNGTKVRGYDPASGKLLWTLGPNSEVTVGTPVIGDGLAYVTGGYPPVRPIYAIKPGGAGDLSLPKDTTSSGAIAWSNDREGTYIPSPIYYDGLLYTLGNNGVLTAYDGRTGERLYRARVGGGGSYAASPIAADGRLLFATEDGDVFIVRAGRTYQELGKNELKEVIMATPAISDGLIFVRTLSSVVAIGGTK
jgi:outer membrane protein assembly factor BamB